MSDKGTASSAGRRLGHAAARVAVHEPLSRISESGESTLSAKTGSLTTKARDVCRLVVESKVAVALTVFLFTFVLLCALNPPMAQQSDTESRSWKKISAWSSLAALVATLLPLVKNA